MLGFGFLVGKVLDQGLGVDLFDDEMMCGNVWPVLHNINGGSFPKGKVFNSKYAKTLYKSSVYSQDNLKLATFEYRYWQSRYDIGGMMGRSFKPRFRARLQIWFSK